MDRLEPIGKLRLGHPVKQADRGLPGQASRPAPQGTATRPEVALIASNTTTHPGPRPSSYKDAGNAGPRRAHRHRCRHRRRRFEGSAADAQGAASGEFIRRAKERQARLHVDWVHLKLNEPRHSRTVRARTPFRFPARDERVPRSSLAFAPLGARRSPCPRSPRCRGHNKKKSPCSRSARGSTGQHDPGGPMSHPPSSRSPVCAVGGPGVVLKTNTNTKLCGGFSGPSCENPATGTSWHWETCNAKGVSEPGPGPLMKLRYTLQVDAGGRGERTTPRPPQRSTRATAPVVGLWGSTGQVRVVAGSRGPGPPGHPLLGSAFLFFTLWNPTGLRALPMALFRPGGCLPGVPGLSNATIRPGHALRRPTLMPSLGCTGRAGPAVTCSGPTSVIRLDGPGRGVGVGPSHRQTTHGGRGGPRCSTGPRGRAWAGPGDRGRCGWSSVRPPPRAAPHRGL